MPEQLLPPDADPVSTLVLFLVIFGVVGAFFLFIHMVMGSVIRPNRPDPEKLTIYECGEPTVGSAWVQFDLRYYVVALLFVIFDVEVAFFFPWATVFGKVNQVAEFDNAIIALHKEREVIRDKKMPAELTPDQRTKLEEVDKRIAEVQQHPKRIMKELEPSGLKYDAKQKLGLLAKGDNPATPEMPAVEPGVAKRWAQVAFLDILIFFGVLMVGFAYVWRRGDIDWVRAYAHHKEPTLAPEKPLEQKVSA